jgi:predicted DsbA family dithiol-disulfide isomerase
VRSFVLKPDIPKEGRMKSSGPTQLSDSLIQAASELGLKMKSPSFIPYTISALSLTELSKQYSLSENFQLAVYSAYWVNQEDIGNSKVLERIAVTIGLPRLAVRRTLQDHSFLPKVIEQHYQAEVLGFKGIPALLIGKTRFVGAVNTLHLQKALENELLRFAQ